jgi:hypothetical protein
LRLPLLLLLLLLLSPQQLLSQSQQLLHLGRARGANCLLWCTMHL